MNVDKYTDQYFLLPKYKVDLQNNKIFAFCFKTQSFVELK